MTTKTSASWTGSGPPGPAWKKNKKEKGSKRFWRMPIKTWRPVALKPLKQATRKSLKRTRKIQGPNRACSGPRPGFKPRRTCVNSMNGWKREMPCWPTRPSTGPLKNSGRPFPSFRQIRRPWPGSGPPWKAKRTQEQKSRIQDLLSRGDQAMDRENFETARDFYQKVLDLDSGHALAQKGLNEAVKRLEYIQWTHALSELIDKANRALENQEFESALTLFDKALSMDSGNSRAKEGKERAEQALETSRQREKNPAAARNSRRRREKQVLCKRPKGLSGCFAAGFGQPGGPGRIKKNQNSHGGKLTNKTGSIL